MPNVIDATGKVAQAGETPASASQADFSERSASSIAPCIASLQTRAPGPPRRSSATRYPAADANRGGRRAPGARGKARFARRSGVTAASSSARSRAATSRASTRRNAASPLLAALADRFQNDAVTLLDPAKFSIEKTAALAKLLFGSAKAARSGPKTLIVCRRDEPHAASHRTRRPQFAAGRASPTTARST